MTKEAAPETATDARMGIGAVSRATGIPVETLRTWERRYGTPAAERTHGGHRLYTLATIDHLRLVQRALAQGHRPKQALTATLAELTSWVGPDAVREPAPAGAVDTIDPTSDVDDVIQNWITAARQFDADALERGLFAEHGRLGTMDFIGMRVVPFLITVGDEWANGRLTVSHEHFVSERVRDFLSGIWRPLAKRNEGKVMLLASLPDEHHSLGLHMAACALAIAGAQIVFLGMDTPVADIATAAEQAGAKAVLTGVSDVMDPGTARRHLSLLRRLLPEDASLVAGGPGAPTDVPGVVFVESMSDLERWARP